MGVRNLIVVCHLLLGIHSLPTTVIYHKVSILRMVYNLPAINWKSAY